MLKKFPSGKIDITKNALVFLSWTLIHHTFTFNSRFLYELKYKDHLSKTLCEIFNFRFRLALIKIFIFLNKKHGLFDFKSHLQFYSRTSDFYVATRRLRVQWYLHELKLPQNWHGDKPLKLRKSKFSVRHFLSMVTFKQIFDILYLITCISFHTYLFL